jgi:hypothetical protein
VHNPTLLAAARAQLNPTSSSTCTNHNPLQKLFAISTDRSMSPSSSTNNAPVALIRLAQACASSPPVPLSKPVWLSWFPTAASGLVTCAPVWQLEKAAEKLRSIGVDSCARTCARYGLGPSRFCTFGSLSELFPHDEKQDWIDPMSCWTPKQDFGGAHYSTFGLEVGKHANKRNRPKTHSQAVNQMVLIRHHRRVRHVH